ncbi:MAG: 3-dehydroquinate synthase family protein [Bacilli bacterium]|jgi:3-dehydroquinate synthetase
MKELKIEYKTKTVRLVFGRGVFTNSLFPEGRKYLVLTDENVARLHGDKFKKISRFVKVLPPGEGSKTLDAASSLVSFLLEEGFTKDDCLVACGGGMITDLGGFVASVYKRGMGFISVPTTLLAQADSALGGKNGVNFASGEKTFKNQIGTIYQPELVAADPLFLKTLPPEEFRSGLGEVLKCGLCFSPSLFARLRDGFDENDIFECLSIKAEITAQDEFEEGARALLNYGHTLGHALESLSGFRLRHGEAVALGLLHETEEQSIKEKIRELLEKYSFPEFRFDKRELADYIRQDKKIRQGKIRLPVLKDIGMTELLETDFDAYLQRLL